MLIIIILWLVSDNVEKIHIKNVGMEYYLYLENP